MKKIPATLDVKRMTVKQPYRCNHCSGSGWRAASDGAGGAERDTCRECDGRATLFTPFCLLCGRIRDGEHDPGSCRCERESIERAADTTGDLIIALRRYASVVEDVGLIDYHLYPRRMHFTALLHNVPRPAFDFMAAWLGSRQRGADVVRYLPSGAWTVDLDLGVDEYPSHGTTLCTNDASALPEDVRRAWEVQTHEAVA